MEVGEHFTNPEHHRHRSSPILQSHVRNPLAIVDENTYTELLEITFRLIVDKLDWWANDSHRARVRPGVGCHIYTPRAGPAS